MGCWSVNCGISNIAITAGNKCVILPLKKSTSSETRNWQPATLPIFGEYNDYGGIEDIEEDDNTKFIEEHFGISIDEFSVFLVDGKFTYDREEATEVAGRIQNLDEAKEWRFMWIDRQVYDFMILNHDSYHKGYNDYGTPDMLKLFGFELIEETKSFKNYDPKRFNQLWKKGDVEIFSDGNTILSKKNQYVYHFGKGNETSIETYFDVPKELEYLKDKSKSEAWRIMSKSKAKRELGYIFGNGYDSGWEELDIFMERPIIKPTVLHKKYYADLERFGDRIVQLINVNNNLHPMSGQFSPHVLYLTPQCGEYRKHQVILEKFAEINKSYFNEDDEDEDDGE